jgi:hypothetical protein
MDLAVKTTSYALDDNSWLGSADGTSATETITINPGVGFVGATHWPNGFIPSGTPLGKITASGLYALYDNAASDGRQTCVGFLYGGVTVNSSAPTTTKLGAARLTRGKVREARLPFAIDSAGKADLASRFDFI